MQKKLFFSLLLLVIATLFLFGCTDSTGSVNREPTNNSNAAAQGQPACAYAYTDWTPATCPSNGIQTRTQTNSVSNCTGTPVLTQTCVYTPQCTSDEISCSGVCKKASCKAVSDCDDNVKGTTDNCLNPNSCTATCSHTPVTTCSDSDGVCPTGCNIMSDNDCSGLAIGTTIPAGDFSLTVSNPTVTICTQQYSTDRTAYFVFDLQAENKGTSEQYISGYNFKAVDPNRKQYEGSFMPYPLVFGGNCADAKNTSFSGGSLLPNSKDSGKVWIKLNSTGDYTKGKWYIVYNQIYSNDYLVYEAQIN